jgi:peptide/nickel transport system substrate-binding protein
MGRIGSRYGMAIAVAVLLAGCSPAASSSPASSPAAAATTTAATAAATTAAPSVSEAQSSAPSASAEQSAATAAEKDVLTLGATLDMYGWNPINQPGYQNWAGDAVWDALVYTDANGQLTPGVADTWQVTNQNKTFTAHIRDGMKFSDGTPVDSAAVKASFEYAANNGGGTADYKGIVIDTPSASSISITWPEPQAVMNSKVSNPKIVPPSYLTAAKWDVPVGSGPYTFDTANSTTGSVYTFNKNESYWDAANRPYKKLVVKVITDDAAAVSALTTGQIDATLVGQTSVDQVKSSGMDVLNFQGQTTRLLLTDHLGKVVKALGDVRVRQAMNMVFDKAAMAKNLYLGNAEPTAQVFRKGTAAFIDGLADPYPLNVDKAKQLMADAGYAAGFELTLPTMTGQNFETLLPYVTQQLALINIKVKEAPLSGDKAIGDLLSGKYPVVLWQLGNLGLSQLQIYIESTPAGWWDLQHQPDEYVDSRYAQIATADEATSKKLQQEINQYQVDQAWFAPMVYMGTNYAYDSKKVSFAQQSDQEALTPKLRDFR